MDFLDFIKKSKTMFHACKTVEDILSDLGFVKLNEGDEFNLKGDKFYVTRNNSSIIAFTIPSDKSDLSLNIACAHLDSPTFKLKPNFTFEKKGYNMINTEVYGGPILHSFMNRPLDIAGRVFVKEKGKVVSKLISFDRAMCAIPSLSIHYDKKNNIELNPQEDLIPLCGIEKVNLLDLIAEKLGCKKDDIISHDLFLSCLDRGCYMGFNNEFIMAPQIDNLESAYSIVNSFIEAKNDKSINICALFDSEEIGSNTRCGARSTFLYDIISRISNKLNISNDKMSAIIQSSLSLSVDNAQGFHPNYSTKYDETNACKMNEGIVIKRAARGSYVTDGYSEAIFKYICDKACVKYQMFTNRSDMPGGSTLGALLLESLSIPSLDIGFAQIAMHSSMEVAGIKDLSYMHNALKAFYESHIKLLNDGEVKIDGVC